MIKLSTIHNVYHLMNSISNNSSNDIFNTLKNYIKIHIIKTYYENLNEQFKQLIKLNDIYNKMIDCEIQKDDSILNCLYINDFTKDSLHIFILIDNASFVIKNEK